MYFSKPKKCAHFSMFAKFSSFKPVLTRKQFSLNIRAQNTIYTLLKYIYKERYSRYLCGTQSNA
jgi:hypothetical protein